MFASVTALRCYSMPTKHDRQVVEGVGEYLQASQSEWDIFSRRGFPHPTREHQKTGWGDGVIADCDDLSLSSY